MRVSAKSVGVLTLSASLFTGLGGCDELPEIDGPSLPEISVPALPSELPSEFPSELPNPFPSESAVDPDPEPAPEETTEQEPAPEDPSPEPEPEPSESATVDAAVEEPAEEPETVWWPWILAGVALLALLVLWWRWYAKRRAWDKRLEEARSEVAWFEDSLIPQILSKPTASEATALWQAARPRVLDLDRELHDLEETAPNEERGASAAQGLDALRGLTDAIDTEASTEAGTDSDSLRARRAAVESARTRAQAWISAGKR
ncbi:hypothetical protein ACNI3K_09480 [Demequina sp. SO4-13]|uniref:hypothetical protein n=1 Tax=Demequina sp. SO4-13 TaxID=3401027 RepID=UPI003AF8A29F